MLLLPASAVARGGLELQEGGIRIPLGTGISALAAPYILASGLSDGYVRLFLLPIRAREPGFTAALDRGELRAGAGHKLPPAGAVRLRPLLM